MAAKGWMERHYMKNMDFVPVHGYFSRKKRLGFGDDEEKFWRKNYDSAKLNMGTDILKAYNILLIGLPVFGGLVHFLGD